MWNGAHVGFQLACVQIHGAGWKETEGKVFTVPYAESLTEGRSSRSPIEDVEEFRDDAKHLFT